VGLAGDKSSSIPRSAQPFSLGLKLELGARGWSLSLSLRRAEWRGAAPVCPSIGRQSCQLNPSTVRWPMLGRLGST